MKHRADGQADLLAEVLEVSLLLAANQTLVLLSEVSSFGDMSNLLDEDAVKHHSLLFVVVAVGLFLV